MSTPSADAADVFARARRSFVTDLPQHFQRLAWSEQQVRIHQTRALRRLLRAAIADSPFHRRLKDAAGDVNSFALDDLPRLPTMTKPEMMERYDEVTTDRRLTRAAVEEFVAGVGDEPALLLGEYVVLASGGSSGVRGLFAWNARHLPDYFSTILRGGLARAGAGRVPSGLSIAMVAARSAIHATRLAAHLVHGAVGQVMIAPADLPLQDITRLLSASHPDLLLGYGGVLRELAGEQLGGRLRITPAMVVSTSEHLTADIAATIEAAFGVAPVNAYGSSEGLNGSAMPGDAVFTFASDAGVIEFVDESDRPVAVGSPAHHVLFTNLLNTTQPLIRYRLDDCMTPQPPSPASGHQRATLQGRTDEFLRFDERRVHPHAVRSVLAHHAGVSEYQVRTTSRSMEVAIVQTGPIDVEQVARELRTSLQAAGTAGIDVVVHTTDRLQRDPRTGKRPLFVSSDC